LGIGGLGNQETRGLGNQETRGLGNQGIGELVGSGEEEDS